MQALVVNGWMMGSAVPAVVVGSQFHPSVRPVHPSASLRFSLQCGSCRSGGTTTTTMAVSSKDDALVESVLWSAADVDKRVGELGRAISRDFEGLPIAVLGVPFLSHFGRWFRFFFGSFCFGVTCEVPAKCFSSFWRFSFIVRMLRPVGFDSGGFLLDVCFCCFFYLFCLVLFCCLFVFFGLAVWRWFNCFVNLNRRSRSLKIFKQCFLVLVGLESLVFFCQQDEFPSVREKKWAMIYSCETTLLSFIGFVFGDLIWFAFFLSSWGLHQLYFAKKKGSWSSWGKRCALFRNLFELWFLSHTYIYFGARTWKLLTCRSAFLGIQDT